MAVTVTLPDEARAKAGILISVLSESLMVLALVESKVEISAGGMEILEDSKIKFCAAAPVSDIITVYSGLR